jgi:hypothetical protein
MSVEEQVLRKVVREELAKMFAEQEPFCTMTEAGKLLKCNQRTAQATLKKLGVPITTAGRKPLVSRLDILRLAGIDRMA